MQKSATAKVALFCVARLSLCVRGFSFLSSRGRRGLSLEVFGNGEWEMGNGKWEMDMCGFLFSVILNLFQDPPRILHGARNIHRVPSGAIATAVGEYAVTVSNRCAFGGHYIVITRPARRRRRRKTRSSASFAWRLTLASRCCAPKAPVRLHKPTHSAHHPSLIFHHFSTISKMPVINPK